MVVEGGGEGPRGMRSSQRERRGDVEGEADSGGEGRGGELEGI